METAWLRHGVGVRLGAVSTLLPPCATRSTSPCTPLLKLTGCPHHTLLVALLQSMVPNEVHGNMLLNHDSNTLDLKYSEMNLDFKYSEMKEKSICK